MRRLLLLLPLLCAVCAFRLTTTRPTLIRRSFSPLYSAAAAAAKDEEFIFISERGSRPVEWGSEYDFTIDDEGVHEKTNRLPGVGDALGSGIRADFSRKAPLYVSDWKDGLQRKSIASILFMYFACLAPTVAFGGLCSIITEGTVGAIEFLLSCGIGGIIYAIFSGQPMVFLGPTGLTLAFFTALYRFTVQNNLPFLVMYAWTGMWTSLFLAICALTNLSELIKYCTRFTDDCFNALLALNFLNEAVATLVANFTRAKANTASAFVSLNLALLTWWSTKKVAKVKQTRLLSENFRKNVADFGPTIIILAMSLLASHPSVSKLGVEYLSVPTVFGLSKGRALIPPLLSISPALRFACIIPALLLTMLFYLDQNITVRTALATNLKKGEAYHLDLLVLSAIVFGLSFCGLPWVCAATVQSLNHIRSLSDVTMSSSGTETFCNITENRVTGFVIHSLILVSLLLLPLLSYIPIPVISGQVFVERNLLPKDNVYRRLPRLSVLKFVSIQAAMLICIWVLKSSKKLALLFPSCIFLLGFFRQRVLPIMFSDEELAALDPPF